MVQSGILNLVPGLMLFISFMMSRLALWRCCVSIPRFLAMPERVSPFLTSYHCCCIGEDVLCVRTCGGLFRVMRLRGSAGDCLGRSVGLPASFFRSNCLLGVLDSRLRPGRVASQTETAATSITPANNPIFKSFGISVLLEPRNLSPAAETARL